MLLLLAVLLLVPATWLALGWRRDLLVGGNDLSLLLLPAMRRLLAVHGDFDAFLYDPSWLGGSKLQNLLGALPLHRLLAALPISSITLLNLTVFFAQALYAYLAAVSARAFYTLLHPPVASEQTTTARHFSWSVQLTIAQSAAFVPVLGWRIGYGHLYILLGALALPAACALILLARARQLTITSCVVAVLTLLHAFPHVGQQPVLYGAVFGLPLVLGLVLRRGLAARELLDDLTPLTLALLGALLCSVPVLTGLIAEFASSDAPRGMLHESFTYSYLVATGRDWLGSLVWSLAAAGSRRPAFALHEINYPIGPVLLCALLCPRKSAGVLWCAAGCAVAVLVFSMDVLPLSRWLLAVLPPLSLFRVPARAALPLLLAVLPLLLALPVLRLPARTTRRDALLLVPGLLLIAAPGAWSELLLWLVVLVCVSLALRASLAQRAGSQAATQEPVQRAWLPSATALLCLLALGGVLGFRERLLPFGSEESLLGQPQAAGAWARHALPELSSPLKRTVSPPDLRANNALYTMGLSGLSGYNLLNDRFIRLYCALLDVPYQASISLITVDPRATYFATLAALYDVVAELAPRPAGTTIERLSGRGAPLWFSERLAARESYEDLVRQLRPSRRAQHGSLRRERCVRTGLARGRLCAGSSARSSARDRGRHSLPDGPRSDPAASRAELTPHRPVSTDGQHELRRRLRGARSVRTDVGAAAHVSRVRSAARHPGSRTGDAHQGGPRAVPTWLHTGRARARGDFAGSLAGATKELELHQAFVTCAGREPGQPLARVERVERRAPRLQAHVVLACHGPHHEARELCRAAHFDARAVTEVAARCESYRGRAGTGRPRAPSDRSR